MMLDFPMYENQNKGRIVGICCECGRPIYNTEDRYVIGNEYCCDECRDIFMDNHIEFGDDE